MLRLCNKVCPIKLTYFGSAPCDRANYLHFKDHPKQNHSI